MITAIKDTGRSIWIFFQFYMIEWNNTLHVPYCTKLSRKQKSRIEKWYLLLTLWPRLVMDFSAHVIYSHKNLISWKSLSCYRQENWDSDKWLSQRHTAEKWQSQCFNPRVSAFRAYILEGEIKVILLIEDWPYVMTSVYGWFHNNPTKIELIPQFQS